MVRILPKPSPYNRTEYLNSPFILLGRGLHGKLSKEYLICKAKIYRNDFHSTFLRPVQHPGDIGIRGNSELGLEVKYRIECSRIQNVLRYFQRELLV